MLYLGSGNKKIRPKKIEVIRSAEQPSTTRKCEEDTLENGRKKVRFTEQSIVRSADDVQTIVRSADNVETTVDSSDDGRNSVTFLKEVKKSVRFPNLLFFFLEITHILKVHISNNQIKSLRYFVCFFYYMNLLICAAYIVLFMHLKKEQKMTVNQENE